MPEIIEDVIEKTIKKMEGPLTLQILKSGLTGGAGAIGGAIVSSLWGMVYYTKAQQKEDEFRDWAANVTYQLDCINSQLANLTSQFSNFATQASADSKYQTYNSLHTEMVKSQTAINAVFNTFSTIISARYKDETSAITAIEKLRTDCTNHNLRTTVQTLANLVGGGEEIHFNSTNMHEAWTDSCIVVMGDDVSSVTRHYYGLEYDFAQCMTHIIKGYTVLAALSNYDHAGDFNVKDETTANWLTSQVTQFIKPLCNTYAMCAERLILATYRPDLKNPYSQAFPFSTEEDRRTIDTRTQLNCFLYTNMDDTKHHPGVVIKEYVRTSMVASKMEATLHIDGQTADIRISGSKLAPPAKYTNGKLMPHWYKAVDINSAKELIAFEDSDIATFMYHVPYADYMKEQNMLFTSPVRSQQKQLVYNASFWYYDPFTLQPLHWQSEDLAERKKTALILGFAGIYDHLTNTYREPFPLCYGHAPEFWKSDLSAKKELEKHAKENTVHVSGHNGNSSVVSVAAEFRSALFSSNHDMSFYAKYPIKYAAKNAHNNATGTMSGNKNDAVKLLLLHNTTLTVFVDDYSDSYARRECRVVVDIFAVEDGKRTTKYYKHRFTANTDIYDKPAGFETEENEYKESERPNVDGRRMGVSLKPGKETMLHWELKFELKGLSKHFGGVMFDAFYRGEISMQAHLAWTVPVPRLG